MSVWEQIVNNYVSAPKINKKAKAVPDTHKKCPLCQQIKPRTEYYKKPGDRSNAVTSKCKPCHIAYNNRKDKEVREQRAQARVIRNAELAEKAKRWSS